MGWASPQIFRPRTAPVNYVDLRSQSGRDVSITDIFDIVWRLRACGTRVPMLHDFASFCCQLSTANDDLPCDVSVVVRRYSWRVDCVYLLRMSPLLRSFSTTDLCVSWTQPTVVS